MSTPEQGPPPSPELPPAAAAVDATALHNRNGVGSDIPTPPVAEVVDLAQVKRVEDESKVTNSKKESGVKAERAPQKGDVFTNPVTGGQQVVEGVRMENGETIIMFSDELEPGVRAEPGRPLRQMSPGRFEVQRQVEGHTELRPVYETEFTEIFNECQEAFEQTLGVYENVDAKAEKVMERVGELSVEVGKVEDAWDALGDAVTPAVVQEKRELLVQLKAIVAELPATLVKPFPKLKCIHDEAKKRVDDDEDQNEEPGQRGMGKRRGDSGIKKRPAGDAEVPAAKRGAARKTGVHQRREGVTSEGAPEHDSGPDSKSGEEEGEEGVAELAHWTRGIIEQQEDLRNLAEQLENRRLIPRWAQAMLALGKEYEAFARTKKIIEIGGELQDIERSLSMQRDWESKAARAEWLDKTTERLQRYSDHYGAILQAGQRVLEEAKRQPSDKTARDRDRRRSRSRGVATIESRQWDQLHPEVQAAVSAEMASMKERVLAFYESAQAKLQANGIEDPDQQHQIIVRRLVPVLAENVQPLLRAAGVHMTAEQMQEISQLQAQRLLVSRPEINEYGGE